MNSYPFMPILSGSALKIIALLSMVIDHCAFYFVNEGTLPHEAMRCFGRIAFPVFAFLVAEGFNHTRNRMKYFLHLLGFAVVSELPWYLLNGADGTHNVMFTLALGVIALAAVERLPNHRILCFCTIVLIAWLAAGWGIDYGWRGILMIAIFYLLIRIHPYSLPLSRITQLLMTFPLMMHYGIIGSLLVCTVLLLYDGTRGFIQGSIAKYGFYAFYPLHLLLILWLE